MPEQEYEVHTCACGIPLREGEDVCVICAQKTKAGESLSHIFSSETKTTTRPRPDATIRIQYLAPDDTKWGGQWRTVQLLEFHPDFDTRMKFRSYAYTSIPDDLIQNGRYHEGVYTVMGLGYLEQPYLSVRETVIHEADLHELMEYCRAENALHKRYSPIIIHPCPLPFPMFAKGDRVVCITTDAHMATEAHVGQVATVAEDSSAGNGTMVTFDTPELNKGTDGRIYPAIGFMSSSLRLLSQGEHLQVVRASRKRKLKEESEK